MNGKRARNIRKLTGTKLPVKADLRVMKETQKVAYFPDAFGETQATNDKKITIVNAAKFNYNTAKKKLKGVKVPNLDKKPTKEVEKND